MKNYVQPGKMITVTLAADILSGAGLLIGNLFGVATKSGVTGEQVEFILEGVVALPKLAAQAQAQGALVYWDDTNKWVTTVASTHKLIGAVHMAALSADAGSNVRLNGVTVTGA
jgi:predicted RecA/RadA family phage recombinase